MAGSTGHRHSLDFFKRHTSLLKVTCAGRGPGIGLRRAQGQRQAHDSPRTLLAPPQRVSVLSLRYSKADMASKRRMSEQTFSLPLGCLYVLETGPWQMPPAAPLRPAFYP